MRFQSPDLTLVEFEQIYDEYIQLSDNKPECHSQELVYAQIVKNSIYLSHEEKQAILSESLESFNVMQREANKDNEIFDMAKPDSRQGDGEEGKSEGQLIEIDSQHLHPYASGGSFNS